MHGLTGTSLYPMQVDAVIFNYLLLSCSLLAPKLLLMLTCRQDMVSQNYDFRIKSSIVSSKLKYIVILSL